MAVGQRRLIFAVMQDIRGKGIGRRRLLSWTRPFARTAEPELIPVDHSTDSLRTPFELAHQEHPRISNVQGGDSRHFRYDGFHIAPWRLGEPASRRALRRGGFPSIHGRRLEGRRLVPQTAHFRLSTSPDLFSTPGSDSRQQPSPWWTDHYDDYDGLVERGLGERHGAAARSRARWASPPRSMNHPAYDAFLAGAGAG